MAGYDGLADAQLNNRGIKLDEDAKTLTVYPEADIREDIDKLRATAWAEYASEECSWETRDVRVQMLRTAFAAALADKWPPAKSEEHDD